MACSISTTFCKARGETLDYKIDWSDWLSSETISTSSWAVSSGIIKDSDTNTTTTATVWVSGGTLGSLYTVTNTIVTSASRTAQRAFRININQR